VFKVFATAAAVSFAACSAQAATYHLLVESNSDKFTGQEISSVSFGDDFDDVVNSNFTAGAFSQVD